MYKYDLFISYATDNKNIADYIVDRIERREKCCFIAPRDVKTGSEYASEIISAISNSSAVLLVFSRKSNQSHYVLREINSAVSRNKPIIPLRIEDFLPSEAMEFYLGPTHWLDAFPQILDIHLDKIVNILNHMQGKSDVVSEKPIAVTGPELLRLSEIGKIGMSASDLTMKEIEIDYLCIPEDRFEMNEEIEGTFDDWKESVQEYEEETSILLVKNDEVIGYCDLYPVTEDAYEALISGRVIIRDTMIDVFAMGGTFNMYISMIGIVPGHATQANYLLMFDWVFQHLSEWKKEGICAANIGVSVYSNMLEKFVQRFGFQFKCLNPAKGKVYETTIQQLRNNSFIQRRFRALDI